ncbi:MAG: hypothetical protein AD742_19595 [Methylibium sp. NZG]|nr:MAG: hypothetical protein AD742_19595 [Methylibium sp. NZG]
MDGATASVSAGAATDSPRAWTAQDGAWATRAALESVPADAPAERFLAERARHAMQRLVPRDAGVADVLQRRVWRGAWWLGAALLGLLLGVLADAVGSGQRINLLAPPVWGVVVWNGVVYALLLGSALRGLFRRRGVASEGPAGESAGELAGGPAGGPAGGASSTLSRGLQRLLDLGGTRGAARRGQPFEAFAARWLRLSARLSAARASGLLYAAAAALGLGLLAGMYLRGLVLDYRAGWESTFLDAAQVHAALSMVFAPALAVSGLALPEVEALQALRFSADAPRAGAPAALWIHLVALTLALFVVLPRTALALWCGWRASRLARHLALPLGDAYFQRLLRHRGGGAVRVQVLPYAQAPGPQAEQGLRAVFGQSYGGSVQVHVAPMLAFGAEDEAAAQTLVPPGTTLAVALFDLTATPEAENQGRFVELLARQAAALGTAGTPAAVLVLIDEAAFVRRLGAVAERRQQRRAAWQALAHALGAVPVFVDLSAPDLPAVEVTLQAALQGPLQAHSPPSTGRARSLA